MGNCVGHHDQVATAKAEPMKPSPVEATTSTKGVSVSATSPKKIELDEAKEKPQASATKGEAKAPVSVETAPPAVKVSDPDVELRSQYLKKVPVLCNLTDADRTLVANALVEKTYASGAAIITQDEPGKEFFIIRSGKGPFRCSDAPHHFAIFNALL